MWDIGVVMGTRVGQDPPIVIDRAMWLTHQLRKLDLGGQLAQVYPDTDSRSEERRVGKEGRSRWSAYH